MFRTVRLLAIIASLPLAPVSAQMQEQLEIDWQTSATDYRGQFRKTFNVYCPPSGKQASVWGSDIYTDDSSVCRAAIHALATFDYARGGTVYFAMEPGQEGYASENRRGISTDPYNAWAGSFRIVAGVPGKRAREINDNTLTEITWATTAKQLRGSVGIRRTLLCPRNGDLQPVWGSGTYNDDSSICAAAVHAGLITRVAGGGIALRAEPGREGYVGSTRNSVTSFPWEKGEGSFQFPAGQVAVALPPETPVVEDAQPVRAIVAAPPLMQRSTLTPSGEYLVNWNTTASEWRGQTGKVLSVYCPPGGASRIVWGSDPYTDDSSVCSAAVHALATFSFARGGTVQIAMAPGQDSYVAGERRGVAASEWGAWESSFRVLAGVPGKRLNEVADTTVTELSWGATAQQIRARNGVRRMLCPGDGKLQPVLGSGQYDESSSVCSAAVQAKLITTQAGGAVTVRVENGKFSFTR